jgi:GT2 family glycosyltransferase
MILERDRPDDAVTEAADPPHSSVIVCTRDRAVSVAATVAGLRGQAGTAPFEIVVVDDGGKHGVAFDDFVGAPVVRVSHIPHQGRSVARNHGSHLARGALLIFVDDDMRMGSDFVAAHERVHRRWSKAIAVGPQVLGDRLRETPFGRFRCRLEERGLPESGGIVHRANFCTAANMSIPRRVFAELGGFNPRLHCAEDQDLALRHSSRGDPIVFLPEAHAVHEDLTLDIRSYSRKMEWTGQHLVDFCWVQPSWPENKERLRLNGPALPGREAALTTAKKLVKSLLGRPAVLEPLFGITALVERGLGDGRLLDSLYRTLVGIHLQKGFRRGLDLSSRIERSGGDAR